MTPTDRVCGTAPQPDRPWQFQERRRHPRIPMLTEAKIVAQPPGTEAPRQPASLWKRVLRFFGATARRDTPTASHGAGRIAARANRLPVLGDRLEEILLELDSLEAWREAADVCAALERIRSRSSAGVPGD